MGGAAVLAMLVVGIRFRGLFISPDQVGGGIVVDSDEKVPDKRKNIWTPMK